MVETRPRLTEEDFMALPDDGRKYELVDGEAQEVPTGVLHEAIGYWLMRLLGPVADAYGIVAGSSAGFRMANGNIRAPDVSFTRWERLPGGRPPQRFGEGAPDLCVEIISPSETYRDVRRKVEEYLASGASQVWLLEPLDETLTIHHANGDVRLYRAGDEVNSGDLLPGFSCLVSDVFDIPRPTDA
jgi:Uma2 family endonuclease